MGVSDPGEHFAVVSGDSLADWMVAQHRESEPRRAMGTKWQVQEVEVSQHEIPGGARLLADLIDTAKAPNFQILKHKWENVTWGEGRLSHYFGTLAPYPLKESADTKKPENFRWRIADNLGIRRIWDDCASLGCEDVCKVYGDMDDVELVALVDSGLGYFDKHEPPRAVFNKEVPWIIVKVGGDGMLDRSNAFWRSIIPERRDKVVLVTTADDLRRAHGVEISQGTAWELAAGDCARMLMDADYPLNRYRFVIVSFGPAGVLLFNRDARIGGTYSLFFDSDKVEGARDFWLNGKMWGYTSALTAAIARGIMEAGAEITDAKVKAAVNCGLSAMQNVYGDGFGPLATGGAPQRIAFPSEAVKQACEGDANQFGEVEVRVEARRSRMMGLKPLWTILGANLGGKTYETACDIVYKGVEEALKDVPRLKYGKVTTVDRKEIESFQSVRSLVRDYAERKGTRVHRYWETEKSRTPVPLSIAIFGAPGSGKSTAVRQVIGSLRIPNREFEFLEFNLSQFRDRSELISSFHLVRDQRLHGKVPVVLWDEFDTYFEQDLGWLRYFLSPMQDGTFQEGQIVHPIGRSVFVFAGGVSKDLDDFKSQPAYERAKGPDFLSRVRGTMELQGINKSEVDNFWMIRRAILLRSILEAETDLISKDRQDCRDAIDPGVLRAFLEVPKFNHGVRSMRAIVVNSSLLGEYYYGRSALPSETQLNLHVDVDAFYLAMEGGGG